jgi:hypothetical protein
MSTTTATAHVKQNDNPHGKSFVQFTYTDSSLTLYEITATIQTVTSDLAALDINEITAQPEDCDSQDVSSDEEESDVTSIKGTEIKHVVPEITAPDHLTEDEKTRFYEMAKFCPSTLLNKDCIHYHKCALIQPCRVCFFLPVNFYPFLFHLCQHNC